MQVLGRQQYIVRPMIMEERCTSGTGSDNPAIAGSSGIIGEAALAHAPALTERNLREYGIPLQQAIEKVFVISASIRKSSFGFEIFIKDFVMVKRNLLVYKLIKKKLIRDFYLLFIIYLLIKREKDLNFFYEWPKINEYL